MAGMRSEHQAIAQGDQVIDPQIQHFVAVFEYMTIFVRGRISWKN
jgi:hypothetical protein